MNLPTHVEVRAARSGQWMARLVPPPSRGEQVEVHKTPDGAWAAVTRWCRACWAAGGTVELREYGEDGRKRLHVRELRSAADLRAGVDRLRSVCCRDDECD